MNDLQSVKRKYGIVGRDPELDKALGKILQVARTDLAVFIQGESGVGKEILPRVLHDSSARKNQKYIAINCGSIPEGTIDSELFGHKKGSFTGALEDREGYFGAANKGTLFLDEVGELPKSTQARLLRVLETGEYFRVGDNEPRITDVRIVAATNVNIQKAIREGDFREDLYYRLSGSFIKMPPLRDRGNDAVLLFKKFTMDTAEKYKMPEPLKLTPEAEEVIRSYKWPGNIRQLKNLAEQMSVFCKDDRIVTPEVLRQYDVVPNASDITDMAPIGGSKDSGRKDYDTELQVIMRMVMQLRKEVDELKGIYKPQDMPSNTTALTTTHPVLPATSPIVLPAENPQAPTTIQESDYTHHILTRQPQDHMSDVEEIQTAEEIVESESLNLADMERRNIIKALQINHYNRKQAALDLGISDRTLYRKIKDYGINI